MVQGIESSPLLRARGLRLARSKLRLVEFQQTAQIQARKERKDGNKQVLCGSSGHI